MERAAQVAPKGVAIGRYVLCDEIAAGGMTTVWLARDREAGADRAVVTIKRLHRELLRDRAFVATAVNEARRASAVRGPNLWPADDAVLVDGRELLFVMEHVRGETLAKVFGACFRSGTRVPVPVAVAIVAGLLRGLAAMHGRGEGGALVHGGLSPQNVLIGADGEARIFDFGFQPARRQAGGLPPLYEKGKAAYFAPEQVRGEPAGPRADLYAAGVILWELLTREHLFRDTGASEIARQIMSHRAPPPSELQPDLPRALDLVVGQAIEHAAAARFADAAAFAAALEAAVPPAPASEVAHWLAGVAAQRMAEIGELTTVIAQAPLATFASSGSDGGALSLFGADAPPLVVEGTPTATPPWARRVPTPRPRRWHDRARRSLPVLLGSLGLAVAGAFALGRLAGSRPVAPPPPAPVTSPAPGTGPAPVTRPAPGTSPAQVTRPPAPSPARPRPAPAVQRPALPHRPAAARGTRPNKPTRSAAALARKPRVDCNPPYFVDKRGIRRIKRECVHN